MAYPELATNAPHSCLSIPPLAFMTQTHGVSGHFSSTPTHSCLRPLPPPPGRLPSLPRHRHGSCCPPQALPLPSCTCSVELAHIGHICIATVLTSSMQAPQELELPINLRAWHRDVYTYSVSDLGTEMICQEVTELPNDSPQKVESRPPFERNRATFLQVAPKVLSVYLCPSWPSSQPSIKSAPR